MENRSYRFISDPDHKENLSGRVRAACLTCRRKKIKCDGEVPCQTCKEKGVRCEGLTERKRPSKTADRRKSLEAPSCSWQTDLSWQHARKKQTDDSSNHRGIPGQATNRSTRPAVIRTDTLGSESSISSGQQSRPNEWESIDPLQQTAHGPSAPYGNQVTVSPFNVGHFNWNFGTEQNMHRYAGSDMLSNDSNISNQLTDEHPEWQERVDSVAWSPENYNREASDLLSAAKMLEAQAQSLRWLASEQHVQDLNEARRQTVTLPLQSEIYSGFNRASPDLKGAFDDIAIIMDRPSGDDTNSSFTTPTCDPNAWLDQECPLWKTP